MANKTEADSISSKALRTAIGNKIREYREQAGISQEDFRKAIGLKNRATLSLIENGEQSISIDALVRVVQITRLDLMSLLELNTRRLLVIDTNIILNRPEMLRVVIGDCDVVSTTRRITGAKRRKGTLLSVWGFSGTCTGMKTIRILLSSMPSPL